MILGAMYCQEDRKKVIGVVENPIKIRLIKRDIARINTVLKEKKIEEFKSKQN